jgi:hypothetical protein
LLFYGGATTLHFLELRLPALHEILVCCGAHSAQRLINVVDLDPQGYGIIVPDFNLDPNPGLLENALYRK